jgi:ferredoxin
MEDKRILNAVVNPGKCWGSNVGEDSGVGACQLCVDICPEVFEKPIANFCAFVRPEVDLLSHESEIQQAARNCPVEAIAVTDGTFSGNPENPLAWV